MIKHLLIVALIGLSSPVSAMQAPLGAMVFCMANASQCSGNGDTRLFYSPDLINNLQRINTKVNRSIRPIADKGDTWSVNVTRGDCEDYALTKRDQLIRSGMPASAIRISTGYIRQTGESHAVLIVRTDNGDYVLDNMRNTVVQKHASGIDFVSISSADLREWRAY